VWEEYEYRRKIQKRIREEEDLQGKLKQKKVHYNFLKYQREYDEYCMPHFYDTVEDPFALKEVPIVITNNIIEEEEEENEEEREKKSKVFLDDWNIMIVEELLKWLKGFGIRIND
jgi:hypothetical protein